METAEKRPRNTRRSDGKRYERTPIDLDILKQAVRYPYLTASYLAALSGNKHKSVLDRLTILRNATVGQSTHYLDWISMQFCTEMIYWAGDKAEDYLSECGEKIPYKATLQAFNGGNNMPHDLAVSLVAANIEVGIRQHADDYAFITPEEIKASSNFRQTGGKMGQYFKIDVDFMHEGKPIKTGAVADNLFGIEAKKKGEFLFAAHEHENENRNDTENYKVASTKRKFLVWLHISRSGLYKAEWGTPNMMLLVTAPSAIKLRHKMDVLHKLTDSKGAPQILFKIMPTLRDMLRPTSRDADVIKVPKPDPMFFIEPWDRVGHPPFSLMI